MGGWHVHTIARAGGTLVAVCDLDPKKAQQLAGRARAYSDFERLLNEIELDVLHVCTPAESHFTLAAAALTRGIHVMIEKPMTPMVTETKRLYELASERQLLICPVHQFLFQRGVKNARAALPSIGRLLHFEATFCSAGAQVKNAPDPDAVIAEILPHPLSLMQLFVPGSLREKGWVTSRPGAGELRATRTAHGVCFSVLISMNSRPTASTLRLLGTAGTIHVDLFHGFCVIEPGAVSRWRKIVHPFDFSMRTLLGASANLARRTWEAENAYPGLRDLIGSFYQAIAAGGPTPITREDACKVAATREQLAGASLNTRCAPVRAATSNASAAAPAASSGAAPPSSGRHGTRNSADDP